VINQEEIALGFNKLSYIRTLPNFCVNTLIGGELVAIRSKFRAVNSKKRNFNEAKLKKKRR
jgi:hypothetical protein